MLLVHFYGTIGGNVPFQMQNREHREQIKTWALNRQDPF